MESINAKEQQFLAKVELTYNANRKLAMDQNRLLFMDNDFTLIKLHNLLTEEYVRLFYEYKAIMYFQNSCMSFAKVKYT